MSDEQGDAEFEASLAGIPQGNTPSSGVPTTPVTSADVRAVHDLRAAIEELARRMGAGFREDLAQIRAIAQAVAERDITDDVRALRREVAALAGQDPLGPVLDEIGAVRTALDRLASAEDVSGVRAELAPLHAALDRVSARLDDDSGRTQVLARFQALETKLDDQHQQLGRLAGDLRAHMADALGDLDGDALLAQLTALRNDLGTGRGTVVEQLQDHLADVASGEVVGALWDEVRSLRDAVDATRSSVSTVVESAAEESRREPGPDIADVLESIATLRAEVEGIGAAVATGTEPSADPAVAGLREDVRGVLDELRGLGEAVGALEQAAAESAVAARDAEVHGDDEAVADPALVELTEELATLRAELAEGLVVEPSDALSASLDALRVEVDGLRSSLADMPAERPEPEPELAPAGPSTDLVATLIDELVGVRAGVDEVRDRIEQGLVLDQELPGPAAPSAEVEVLADQIASLRDLVSSEVDDLRQSLVAAADRAARAAETASERAEGASRSTEAPVQEPPAAPAPAPVVPTEVQASLDGATLEMLRDEIRAAGAVGDEVVDALRQELKALRRRIAVKASERVLDDAQLAQIADAVAERLGNG